MWSSVIMEESYTLLGRWYICVYNQRGNACQVKITRDLHVGRILTQVVQILVDCSYH